LVWYSRRGDSKINMQQSGGLLRATAGRSKTIIFALRKCKRIPSSPPQKEPLLSTKTREVFLYTNITV